VDSSTANPPGRSSRPTDPAAAVTAVRSGPLPSRNGVGTQMTATSTGPTDDSSSVARNPALSMYATSSSVTSSMCDRPLFSVRTALVEMSNPTTDIPARVASGANGKPVYSSPTTMRSVLTAVSPVGHWSSHHLPRELPL